MRTLLSILTRAVAVRIRWLAGDPELRPLPLDQLHTRRNFDRIYLLATPFFFYHIHRNMKRSKESSLPDLRDRQE